MYRAMFSIVRLDCNSALHAVPVPPEFSYRVNQSSQHALSIRRTVVAAAMQPVATLARVRTPLTHTAVAAASSASSAASAASAAAAASVEPDAAADGQLFMRLDFCSRLDGRITAADRPPIDAVFVVDTSGSMQSGFPDDTDGRSKLAVAVECVLRIAAQLQPTDAVALVRFDTGSELLVPLARATPAHVRRLRAACGKMHATGGTNLAGGLQSGYDVLRDDEAAKSDAGAAECRLRRVFVLTGMDQIAIGLFRRL